MVTEKPSAPGKSESDQGTEMQEPLPRLSQENSLRAASLPAVVSTAAASGKKRRSLDRSMSKDPYEFIPNQAPVPKPNPTKGRVRSKTQPTTKKKGKNESKSAKGVTTVDALTKEITDKRTEQVKAAKEPPQEVVQQRGAAEERPPEIFSPLPDSVVECSVPVREPPRKKFRKRGSAGKGAAVLVNENREEKQVVVEKRPERKKSSLLAMFANDTDLEESFSNANIRRSPPKTTYTRRANASNTGTKQGVASPVEVRPVSPMEEDRATPEDSDGLRVSQPTPLPVKKRFSRKTFDLEADSEAVEEVIAQYKIPRKGSSSSSVADASFVTCPSSDAFSEDHMPQLQDSEREPFPDSDEKQSSGVSGETWVGRRSPPSQQAGVLDESIVIPETESYPSTATGGASTRVPVQARVDDLEDGVISETSESEDEEEEPPQDFKKKKANGDDSDSDESIILGTPSSQHRRRSISSEERETNKENELPLLKPGKIGALMTSGLEPRDNIIVQKLIKRFNLSLARDFNDEVGVTHVIVGQDAAGVAPRTMKFLMGISRNNFVVTIDWAIQSMRKRILANEERFLAEAGDIGPRKTLEAKRRPLVGIAVMVKSCDEPLKAEEVETLATNMGARVLKNILEYDGRGTLVVLASEADRNDRMAERLWGFGAVLVTNEWLIECAASYSCVSLYEYISHPELKRCLKSIPCVDPKLAEVPSGISRLSKFNFGSTVRQL